MKRVVAGACGAAIVLLAPGAMTARADERHGGARAEHRAEHFDERYSHNHYYPGRGGYVRGVPGRPFIVERGGGRYFYSGGFPYYYANDTYYAWRDAENGYEVVEPPSDQGASTQAPPSDDLFIYPKNGQPADQQANDKYECHKWASAQTGFDPTQSAGGVPPEQAGGKHADYQRAMRACLEGRGYSVR